MTMMKPSVRCRLRGTRNAVSASHNSFSNRLLHRGLVVRVRAGQAGCTHFSPAAASNFAKSKVCGRDSTTCKANVGAKASRPFTPTRGHLGSKLRGTVN